MRKLYERFIPELKSDTKNIRRIDNVANLPIKATVPLSSRDKVIVTSRKHQLTNNAKHRKIAEHAVGKKIIVLVQKKYT